MTDDEDVKRRWWPATVVAFSLSGLLMALALLSLDAGGKRLKHVDLPGDIFACAAVDDCTLVDKIGCCSCQSGGARWAINRDRQDALRRALKHICEQRATCVAIDTCRDDLRAACREGRCVAEINQPLGAAPL